MWCTLKFKKIIILLTYVNQNLYFYFIEVYPLHSFSLKR